MTKAKNIGMGYKPQKEEMEENKDKHDPFFGKSKIHGRTFTGVIIKKGSHRTVTVEWPRTHFDKKYERYEKRRTRVKAHNPDSISADVGDRVTIVETSPISKTKKFIIVKIEQK
jgi:small subunit ribosomal protein S17